ncbi:MAG: hypothetical protein OES69_11600 [Myxococcales bacterium]|nr:hypothetical protein [Myxococcales bacterium]
MRITHSRSRALVFKRNALFLTTLVLAITIWGSPVVDAQEDAGAKTELASAQASAADQTHEASTKFAVSAAYYGELITHPGFSLGMEYYFFENKWFAAFVSPQVGWYIHPRNHFALFIEGNIGARFTARFGLFGEVLGGLGYFHRWTAGGRVYSRDSDGSISSRFAVGSAKLKVNGRLGFGWDFARNNLLPIAAFVRVGVFGEYPYNNYMLLHGSFEAGVIYRF